MKLIHAVPSGGQRAQIVGTMMKSAGVRKGVWDVCMPFPRGPHHYAYMEFKRPVYRGRKAGGLTPEQVEFGKMQLALGAYMQVVYGWEEAREKTLEYIGLGEFRLL